MTLALFNGVFAPAAILSAMFVAGSLQSPQHTSQAPAPAVHGAAADAPGHTLPS